MNEHIIKHVAYSCDDHYFTYTYVSIKTLLESNANLVVHFLYQDVPEEHLMLLRELGTTYNVRMDIRPFEMPAFFEMLPAFGVASKTTYAKLIFCTIFPELDRILYLDPDTMVLNDITDFYTMDMGNNMIAGVIENLPYYHRKAVHLSEEEPYINGGMVLCNLKEWRKNRLEEKAVVRMQDTSMNLNYDQGILNELCRGKVMVVAPKYNALAEVFQFASREKLMRRYNFKKYYTQEEIEEAINHPVIIHFTHFLYGKPMSYKCSHPYAENFRKIVIESPLAETLNTLDIDSRAKVRRFFLKHTPFSVYLAYESIMDVRREKDMLKGKSY